ncbi:hypothetical protein MASR2M78_19440 [Treponema sp.]
MKKRHLVAASLLLCLEGTAFSQTSPNNDPFLKEPSRSAPWLLDWGGGISLAGVFENNTVSEEPSLDEGLGTNLWLRLSLPLGWQSFFRVKDSLSLPLLPRRDSGLELSHEWELNAAYVQWTYPIEGVLIAVGRKPFSLGSGIALKGNGDGLELKLSNPDFRLQVSAFYTGFLNTQFNSYSMNDADEQDGSKRYFGAYSLGLGLRGHELSLLGMYQSDFTLKAGDIYTSWYSGLQAKGLLFDGDYLLEWIMERGRSSNADGNTDIQAYGGLAQYQRFFNTKVKPRISLSYGWASGDPDRTNSEGSNGNVSGKDAGFQAFGPGLSSLAFAPNFSNLHVIQMATSISPLSATSRNKLNLGLNYTYFAKFEKQGLVNGNEAPQNSIDLGHALDAQVQWAPYQDLSFFIGSGIFLPGAAFHKGESIRYSLSAGLSLSL